MRKALIKISFETDCPEIEEWDVDALAVDFIESLKEKYETKDVSLRVINE